MHASVCILADADATVVRSVSLLVRVLVGIYVCMHHHAAATIESRALNLRIAQPNTQDIR